MNKIGKYTVKAALITIVVAGCIYGGRVEYNDTVTSGMSAELYNYVRDHIGGGSRSDVVDEYQKHKNYYDSIINQ